MLPRFKVSESGQTGGGLSVKLRNKQTGMLFEDTEFRLASPSPSCRATGAARDATASAIHSWPWRTEVEFVQATADRLTAVFETIYRKRMRDLQSGVST